MKHTNKSGLRPNEYRGLEILTDHGMRFAIIDKHAYFNNPQRAREQVLRDASLSLRKLETLDATKIIVGITGSGVDAIVRNPDVQSWALTEIVLAIPKVLAKTINNEGVETYYVQSTGLPNLVLPGLEVLTENRFIILPSPTEGNQESVHWLPIAETQHVLDLAAFESAVNKWEKDVEQRVAAERELQSARAYVEQRKVQVITSKASRLNRSLKKVRNSSGLNKFEMARKQCYSLGHYTDNDPQLNEIIVDSLVKEVLVGNSFTGKQVEEITERLNTSLKAGIAHQRKIGRR